MADGHVGFHLPAALLGGFFCAGNSFLTDPETPFNLETDFNVEVIMGDEQQGRMKWLDLSAHGVRLVPRRLPSGTMVLVLMGQVDSVKAQRLGFQQTDAGVWFTTAYSLPGGGLRALPVGAFRQEYPQAQLREMPINEVLFIAPPTTASADEQDDLTRDYEVLGVNAEGQTVYRDAVGRLVKAAGEIRRPEKTGRTQPAFLLGGSMEFPAYKAWPAMLKGQVSAYIQGAPVSDTELRRLYCVLLDLPNDHPWNPLDLSRLQHVHDALEIAAGRVLGEMLDQRPEAFDDVLRVAAQLDAKLPRLSENDTNDPMLLERGFTPFLGAVAGYLLRNRVKDRRVLLPYAGNGMLANFLPGAKRVDILLSGGNNNFWAEALAVKGKPINVQEVPPSHYQYAPDSTDVLVLAAPHSGRGGALDGYEFERASHYQSAVALTTLTMQGEAVLLIPGAPEDNRSTEHSIAPFLEWGARHYRLGRVLRLDSATFAGNGLVPPAYLVHVRGRRWVPEPDPQIPEITECYSRDDVLQALAVEFQEQERLNIGALSEYLRKFQENADAAGLLELNEYQRPYVPLSSGEPSQAVPKNLITPTRKALVWHARRHGVPEDTIARITGWDRELLQRDDFLSPEQKDAIALAHARLSEGEGFLLADSTGVGKGRAIVALLYAAIQRGETPIFLTKSSNLFSDLWRDVCDLGLQDEIRPLPISQAEIETPDGTVAHRPDPAAVRHWVATGKLPGGYNLLMVSYPTLAKAAAAWNPRRRRELDDNERTALAVIRHAEDALVVLDESHVATGTGNYYKATSRLVANAESVLYSSATAMRDPRGARLYSRLLPKRMQNNVEELVATIRRGGAPLQEVFSQILVENGAMIRREPDFSGLRVTVVEGKEWVERNKTIIDAQAEFFTAVRRLGTLVDNATASEQFRTDILAYANNARASLSRIRDFRTESMGFADFAHLLITQTNLAMNQNVIAREALRALEAGKKPVVIIDQTASTLHEMLLPERNEQPGLLEGENRPSSAGAPYPDIKDILHRVAENHLRIRLYPEGRRRNTEKKIKPIHIHVLDDLPPSSMRDAIQDAYDRVLEVIEQVPDLPYAPIDFVREAVQSRGYRVVEVSGRRFEVHRTAQGAALVRRKGAKKTELVRRFNDGAADMLIGTRAISTGASLHASPRFKDRRQRVLIEGQVIGVISERIQVYGRVNRRDQVVSPEVVVARTGTPAEDRILALSNKHLEAMSATVTSNKESAQKINAIDIFNHYGDQAAVRLLLRDSDLRDKLGVSESMMETWAEQIGNGQTAQSITGRLMALRFEEQTQALQELEKEYQSILENELGDQAENILRGELDLRATVERRIIYDGEVKTHYDNVFERPVEMVELRYIRKSAINDPKKLDNIIATNTLRLQAAGHLTESGIALPKHTQAFQDGYEDRKRSLARQYGIDLHDMTKQNAKVSRINYDYHIGQLDRLQKLLPHLKPGMVFGNSEFNYTLILDVTPPPLDKVMDEGAYIIRSVDLFKNNITEKPLSHLHLDPSMVALFDARHRMRRIIEEYKKGRAVRQVALQGNLFWAAEIASKMGLGRPVVYTDAAGARHRAILCPLTTSWEKMLENNVRFKDATMALACLQDCAGLKLLSTRNYNPKKTLRVLLTDNELVIDDGKENDRLAQVAQRYRLPLENTTKQRMGIRVPRTCGDLVNILGSVIYRVGELFPDKHPEYIQRWQQKYLQEQQAQTQIGPTATKVAAGKAPAAAQS